MRTGTLPALVLACGAIACSGQPRGQFSGLDPAYTACSGVIIPLPEGATSPVLVSAEVPQAGPHATYSSAMACLEVLVEVDGSVTYVRTISSTNAAFGDAFRQAVARWRYQPAELDGKPLPVRLAVSAALREH